MSASSILAPVPGLQMPGLEAAWSQFVTVRDAAGIPRRWHLLDNGAAPERGTMLCVHGNPTWSYLWRRFLAEAPAGWRVVAIDHLGMGYSERLEQPRGLAERVDDLDRLVAALEITGPVVVAAHDWGGPIALGWAERHVDRLRGIVLTNTGVALPPGTGAPAELRLARSPVLRKAVCVRTDAFIRAAAALSRPALSADVRAALRAPYGTASRRRAIGDFVADIPFEATHPSRPTLDGIAAGLDRLRQVPALLLWGPRDPVFDDGYLHDLLSRLPHADVHRYAGASHLVMEDRPQVAADAWRWVGSLGAQRDAPPAAPGTAPSLLVRLRGRVGDPTVAVAEVGGGEPRLTSFGELNERVGALAGGLIRAGVQPGHRVGLLVRPGLDLTTAVYACWRAGASIVVADAGLGLRRLGDALRSAHPDWVIGIPAGLAAAAALGVPGRRIVAGRAPKAGGIEYSLAELMRGPSAPDSEPPDEAEGAVLFTSGATGPPKGVVYRHRQLRAQLDLVRTICRVTADDRLVAAFAPFALYGPALGIGAAVPDMDVTRPGSLTAIALADAAGAIGATLVFASPAALRNVAATAGALNPDQRRALDGIRLVLSAGAPHSPALLRRVQAVLPRAELHTPYGMTEALPIADISLAEIESVGPGNGACVGPPLPGVRVSVCPLDAVGAATGELTSEAGITGEVCVASAHVKDRYDRLWATEQASSRNAGWHRTGDVGHLDEQGRLWIEGRLVHVITTAEGPVTPVAIEHRVESLDDVEAAAVVGVGPVGTQQVVVIVVPSGDRGSGVLADPPLAAAVRAVAPVSVAAVLVVAELPTDIRHQSKIDRQRLARWAGQVLSGGAVRRP